MGSEFVRAEATYLSGFNIVTFGDWVGEYLRKHYDIACMSLPFSVDRTIYYPRLTHRVERALFFAKPEMPRRCFEVCSEALRIFKHQRPDIEVCLFGSDSTKGMHLGFEFTDLGVVTDLHQLAELYRGSQFGIVVSTTNPSILGYEMLACGCPVVDLDRPDLARNYRSQGLGVIPAKPFARDFAGTLTKLMADGQSVRRHQNVAPSLVDWMPTDVEVGRRFVSYVEDFLRRFSIIDDTHRDSRLIEAVFDGPSSSATRDVSTDPHMLHSVQE